MSYWDDNLKALQARFPRLAEGVLRSGFGERICSFKARDGSVAYGIQQNGQIQPVTNPIDPMAKMNAQLNQWSDELRNFARPVLVLGVHPGLELLHIFNLREKAPGHGHCDQSLWICIDSMPAFCGFLQTFNAVSLIQSPRVQLFSREEMPAKVEWLRANPQFPYLFSMISVSPPQIQEAVLAPMVQLIQERSALIKKFQDENEAYYAGISDEQLAEALAGKAGRKPRLMVPTCIWSSVIQYSIRDTVSAFERAGWETMVLAPEGMMTPFFAMESINRFKPDLFLHVNHLRTESEGVLPRNMMVVSWIQDPLPSVNNHETAQKWNEMAAPRNRDLIVGYIGQLKPYGYLEERLSPLSMIVDTEIFKPRELTPEQIEKYGCDVMFASNCGLPTDRLVKEILVHVFEEYGVDEYTLMDYHDRLWEYYRAEKTITSYQQLIDFLQLDAKPEDTVTQRLFWRLNDVIYRHTVIEWLDEYAQRHPGFKLHLYGQGWDKHPSFSKYAKGKLSHGEELSIAYQAAKYSLHLNAAESVHQRILEIASSAGTPLTRRSYSAGSTSTLSQCDWQQRVANFSKECLTKETPSNFDTFRKNVTKSTARYLAAHPLALVEMPKNSVFYGPRDFSNQLATIPQPQETLLASLKQDSQVPPEIIRIARCLLGAPDPEVFQTQDTDDNIIRTIWLMRNNPSSSDLINASDSTLPLPPRLYLDIVSTLLSLGDKTSAKVVFQKIEHDSLCREDMLIYLILESAFSPQPAISRITDLIQQDESRTLSGLVKALCAVPQTVKLNCLSALGDEIRNTGWPGGTSTPSLVDRAAIIFAQHNAWYLVKILLEAMTPENQRREQLRFSRIVVAYNERQFEKVLHEISEDAPPREQVLKFWAALHSNHPAEANSALEAYQHAAGTDDPFALIMTVFLHASDNLMGESDQSILSAIDLAKLSPSAQIQLIPCYQELKMADHIAAIQTNLKLPQIPMTEAHAWNTIHGMIDSQSIEYRAPLASRLAGSLRGISWPCILGGNGE